MKTEPIQIRVTAEWKQKVGNAAKTADKTMSQYMRDAINEQMKRDARRSK